MDRELLYEKLKGIIADFIESQGLILVDIIFRREGKDSFLRILADRPQGGISLQDCAQLSNQIGVLLDREGLLYERYILEVSSPGIDRPLKTKDDFSRCVDKDAVFFLKEPIKGSLEIEARIVEVNIDAVKIKTDNNLMDIPLDSIVKAKQKF